jgi:hypothetical protein
MATAEHAHDHELPTSGRALDRLAVDATLHCLTGCAIGEVLGMVIGSALGFSEWGTVGLAVVLAFIFGYGLTSLPLLRAGLALGTVIPVALASDTFSIATMEIVDNAIILIVPGAFEAGTGDILFWGSLAFALALAGVAAFPVNRWLLARGKGHAAVHETGIHGGPSPRVVGAIAAVLAAFGIVVLAAEALAVTALNRPLPGAKGCRIFPASSHWNQRVDRLPVAGNSDRIVRSIGAGEGLHPDFGSGRYQGRPIGIPYTTVPRRQRRVRVSFDYADESDRGRYPIPRDAPVEGGRRSDGDRHVIVVDRARCRLFELFAAYPVDGGRRWRAGSGAIWNLRSNELRPEGWTSADAAGLPILPGLARYHEVRRGSIDHALRFTVSQTRRAYVYPARHFASNLTDPDLPPMGLRLRLRAGFDTSGFPRQSRVVLNALKRYGMLVADNGSDWFISGAPHRRWDNDDLHSLQRVEGRNFEVVDTSSLPQPGR